MPKLSAMVAPSLLLLLSLPSSLRAATEKPATPPKPAQAAPAPVLRGAEVDLVAGMASGLLKTVLGKTIDRALFPSQAIDLNRLLGDISADVRRQLIAHALAGNEAALGGAVTALADFKTRREHGASDALLLDEFGKSSAISTINTVLSGTGPTSPYFDPGLPLYLAAVQLKANAYAFRRTIEPGQEASNNAVIIRLLEEAIPTVRNAIDRRRAATLDARLNDIVPCHVSSTRTHGFPPWLTRTYLTTYWDKREPQHRDGGSQADDDEPKALARCEGRRQPYYDRVRKSASASIDPKWAPMVAIVDTWAETLDALKGTAPEATARMQRLDFGGFFGAGEGGLFSNVMTNTPGCPGGYSAFGIKGTTNVDWPSYYCGRFGAAAEPVADFGGMYGKTNDADHTGTYWIPNAITGQPSCPAGFAAASIRNQHELYYCWKRHVPGTKSPYLFGGLFSPNGNYANPMTDRKICPTGYSPALVHGTRGGGGVSTTREVVMCWRANP